MADIWAFLTSNAFKAYLILLQWLVSNLFDCVFERGESVMLCGWYLTGLVGQSLILIFKNRVTIKLYWWFLGVKWWTNWIRRIQVLASLISGRSRCFNYKINHLVSLVKIHQPVAIHFWVKLARAINRMQFMWPVTAVRYEWLHTIAACLFWRRHIRPICHNSLGNNLTFKFRATFASIRVASSLPLFNDLLPIWAISQVTIGTHSLYIDKVSFLPFLFNRGQLRCALNKALRDSALAWRVTARWNLPTVGLATIFCGWWHLIMISRRDLICKVLARRHALFSSPHALSIACFNHFSGLSKWSCDNLSWFGHVNDKFLMHCVELVSCVAKLHGLLCHMPFVVDIGVLLLLIAAQFSNKILNFLFHRDRRGLFDALWRRACVHLVLKLSKLIIWRCESSR